jgi:hypothetical protein
VFLFTTSVVHLNNKQNVKMIRFNDFSNFSGSESQWGKGQWHDHELPPWKLKEELKNTFRCNQGNDETNVTNESIRGGL